MADDAPLAIALLTHTVNPRGVVVHVLELGRALLARGHAVTVIVPAVPGQRLFRDTPCRVVLAPTPPPAATLAETVCDRRAAFVATLRALLQRERFDLFHAHDGIGATALADLTAEGLIPGYLRTVHHLERFDDPRIAGWEERSIRGAARVLCVSRLWRARLCADWGIEASQVPNGVDRVRFSPQAALGDAVVARRFGIGGQGRPAVLAVGGIEARKNTRRLLAAFVQLRRRLPAAQLVVVGGASVLDHAAEVRAFCAEVAAAGLDIGPGRAVVVTGPLADGDMAALYRCARVLAMPSLVEGFGLAALEALACGTPVVVSRIEPFTEHFGDDDVAWADPLDVASIEGALLCALARRPGSVPAVCRRFGWDASAARHEALYRLPLLAGAVPP